MVEFLRDGGYSMWFMLLFALVTLASAIGFAVRADMRKLAVVRAMTWATVFAVLTGLLANFLALMRALTRTEWLLKSPDLPGIVMQGLGETVTVGILGFAFLAITWLVVALGTRRIQDPAD